MQSAALSEQLFLLIVRRPFRRTAVDFATATDIRQKIDQAIHSQQPIRFSLPFGGYKAAHLTHQPHLNWAEVFWLDYLRQYAEPLAQRCEQGVVFSFSYMSGVLPLMNQTDPAAEAIYLAELQQMMTDASCGQIQFELVDLAEAYGGPAKAMQAVQQRYQQFLQHWPISEKSLQNKLASARRNLPASSHSDPAAVQRSAMLCAAMESLELRRQFNKYGQHIQLSHIKGGSLALHIGSCRGSVMQPWVGYGVIQQGVAHIVSQITAGYQTIPPTAAVSGLTPQLQQAVLRHASPALTTICNKVTEACI